MPDVFDDLDELTLTAIGDDVTYTPAGGTALSIRAWIDHSPDVIDFGVTAGVSAEASAQVRKIDVPVINKDGDRIALPRTGRTYRLAAAPQHSRCGRLWNISLIPVPA